MVESRSVGVLGPLELRRGRRAVHIASGRQRALLLRMIVGGGRASSDALVEALWGASPPRSARSTLKSHASNLRATLREVDVGLRSQRGGYELVLDPMDVDANRFERLCREARDLAAPEALELMATALGLWRGRAFAEVRHEPFALPEATRLEELRLQAIEHVAELKLALGRHHEVVADLEPVVCQHPFREQLHARLILALYRCGRQAEALRLHASLRARLRDELGVDPSPELDQLELAILNHHQKIADPGVSRDSNKMLAFLPSPIGSLIGRAADVEEVVSTVERHRLVVLTGPAGVGKTRVAIAAAHEVAAALPDGAVFVDLSVVHDAASVPASVAHTVAGAQVGGGGDIVGGLCSWLADRELLLVVDNCEHLLDAAADVVERVLVSCRGVRVLATSRESLGIAGEVAWPVPALPVRPRPGSDDATSPAVSLFVERARAVRPSFRLSPANERSLVDICDSLDGLPLAIELAAARITHLTPAQIADHLTEHSFLVDESRRSPRHRALDVAITSSVDLLDEFERRLFLRLSVFAGEFSLDAAAAICVDDPIPRVAVMNTLAALVRKSLVVTLDVGAVARYRLLQTLRRFAADGLDAIDDVAQRRAVHAAWYLRLAEEAEPHLKGQNEAHWLDRLQHEHDDLRSALRWLLDNGRS
ncbi:MAG: AfsR family transcriptional regulator, partial [Chloroflexota bacterium]|nr:AfsR family transcriptional regulator [Chloroflexota bacterium]